MQQIIIAILSQGRRDRSAAEAVLAQGFIIGVPWLSDETAAQALGRNADIAS